MGIKNSMIDAKIVRFWLASTAALFSFSSQVYAQQPLNSVEVLVNDEPLSSFDVNQRLRLVIAISGGVSNEKEFQKVREQVVQAMVDERLQLQEAKEFELEIPREQLEDFFTRRAEGTGQKPEQFEQALISIGSSKETMLLQINAEYAWSEIVSGRLRQFVNVSDEEIESYIARIKANRGKFEYHLAEISLLVDNAAQEASAKRNAESLVERLRAGSSFPDIAQQLSASPTAATGGNLGWLTEDDMSEAQRNAVKSLKTGGISEPIRTPGGFTILTLLDQRRILTADPVDDELHLFQLLLPLKIASDPDRRAHFDKAIDAIRSEGVDCHKIDDYVTRVAAEGPKEIGIVRLRGMSRQIRDAMVDIPEGGMGPILEMDDGVRALLVCAREEAQVGEPDPEQIRNQLEQQRLATMGRRYLRDLRRKAIVDYR